MAFVKTWLMYAFWNIKSILKLVKRTTIKSFPNRLVGFMIVQCKLFGKTTCLLRPHYCVRWMKFGCACIWICILLSDTTRFWCIWTTTTYPKRPCAMPYSGCLFFKWLLRFQCQVPIPNPEFRPDPRDCWIWRPLCQRVLLRWVHRRTHR